MEVSAGGGKVCGHGLGSGSILGQPGGGHGGGGKQHGSQPRGQGGGRQHGVQGPGGQKQSGSSGGHGGGQVGGHGGGGGGHGGKQMGGGGQLVGQSSLFKTKQVVKISTLTLDQKKLKTCYPANKKQCMGLAKRYPI